MKNKLMKILGSKGNIIKICLSVIVIVSLIGFISRKLIANNTNTDNSKDIATTISTGNTVETEHPNDSVLNQHMATSEPIVTTADAKPANTATETTNVAQNNTNTTSKSTKSSGGTATKTSSGSSKSSSSSTSSTSSGSTTPSKTTSQYYVAPPASSGMNDAMRNAVKKIIPVFDGVSPIPFGYNEGTSQVYKDLNGILLSLLKGEITEATAKDKFLKYKYESADGMYNFSLIPNLVRMKKITTSSNDAKEIANIVTQYLGSWDYNNYYIFYDASNKQNIVAVASSAFHQY